MKSKKIYKGRIIELSVDTLKIKNRTVTREIISHPGAAVILPILNIKKKEIVLIKQYRYAAKKNLFEIPAGTREKNETFLKCAKREIIEETGYKSSKMKKVMAFYPSPGVMSEKMELFIATGLKQSQQNLDIDEVIDVHVFTLDKCVKMIFDNKIEDGKTIAGILTLDRIYKDKELREKYFS